MKPFNLTVKNYKAFSDFSPVSVQLGEGFTAFVGPNNSGKSSLLKFILEMRNLWGQLVGPVNIFNSLVGKNPIGFTPLVRDVGAVVCDSTDRPTQILIDIPGDETPLDRLELRVSATSTSLNSWSGSIRGGQPLNEITQHDGTYHVHVRTNDGMRPVSVLGITELGSWLSGALYIGPFRNLINVGSGDYYGISIGSGFIARWHSMKNGDSRAAQATANRVVQDLERIFGIGRLEINAAADNSALIVSIDRRPYRLEEMGSGFAQFVQLFTEVASRNPTLLLLDEPELHLHPSLQADFLTSLASYTQTKSVIFATHSLGLARSVADRVYSFQRVDGVPSVRPFENTAGLAEFLGEMSFAGFKELGHTAILLVEGTTEVKAVQQFLRMIGREHSVVVVPLGGSSMINGNVGHELSELKRLGGELFALIDSERNAEHAGLSVDRAKFMSLCEELGISAHATQRRAFDNYLSDEAIQRVKGERYSALGPHERLGDRQPAWAKHEGWRIAREMAWEDIKDTDIGAFLNTLP